MANFTIKIYKEGPTRTSWEQLSHSPPPSSILPFSPPVLSLPNSFTPYPLSYFLSLPTFSFPLNTLSFPLSTHISSLFLFLSPITFFLSALYHSLSACSPGHSKVSLHTPPSSTVTSVALPTTWLASVSPWLLTRLPSFFTAAGWSTNPGLQASSTTSPSTSPSLSHLGQLYLPNTYVPISSQYASLKGYRTFSPSSLLATEAARWAQNSPTYICAYAYLKNYTD